jgi:hypothetical protein
MNETPAPRIATEQAVAGILHFAMGFNRATTDDHFGLGEEAVAAG